MVNFYIPLEEPQDNLPSQKEASQEAFFAAASSKKSKDPISDFLQAQNDLITSGNSPFIQQEKEDWKLENNQLDREALVSIVEDSTYTPELKKALIQNFELTKEIHPELKERYIQKTAAEDTSIIYEDAQDQEDIINTLELRKVRNRQEVAKENIFKGSGDVLYGTGEGLTGVGAKFLMSIKAGYMGVLSLIKDKNPEKASQLIQEINEEAYSPKTDSGKIVEEKILRVLEILGIPAKKVADYIFEKTESPGAATTGLIVLDPVNLLGFGLFRNKVKGKPPTPSVPKDSPLETTNVANPVKAEMQAGVAITEKTGQVATALGADKGDIIHDWVLPKIMPDEVSLAHPDLTASLKTFDGAVRKGFQDIRYNPSMINATEREIETAKVFKIIKESRSPYYIQSMSLINETDKIFEGNAVYGKNSTTGYSKEADVRQAYETLKKNIDLLPEELKGTLDIVKYNGKYYINHQWKKEIDDLSDLVFGKDSIQTSFLGMNVSPIARSYWGRWLFPTGRIPKEFEKGAMRGEEHAARLQETLTKPIRDKIAGTKFGKELDYVINHAEENGIDYYSKARLGGMFPKLSKADIDELHDVHIYWRRQQQYNHNFANLYLKEDLIAKEMQGIYDGSGNYMGAATTKISPSELLEIREVFDFEVKAPIKYNEEVAKKEGKTLVRLNEKIREGNNIFHYGLIGKNTKLNLLPNEVLTRIPGYSGRKVNEAWYVDVIPTSLKINGLTKTDKIQGLQDYVETKAAAKTRREGERLAEQFQKEYPDALVKVRPERSDNFGRVLTDYTIHQEMLKYSMKRGERLPSLYGPARLEDRMLTLLNTTKTLSRIGGFRAWDEAFQKAFIKGFPEFTKGQFPQYATDISFKGHLDVEGKQKYRTAHELFKFYERMKNYETKGDFLWTEHLHGLADILEKWKVPTDALRGKHQNPLMLGKTASTVAYIHLSPIRQRLIQPAQQLEMYMINPRTAPKNAALTSLIQMSLGSESKMMQHVKPLLQKQMLRAAALTGEKEFPAIVEAIKQSGMIQSIDMNTIVHGVFKEVNRNLVENIPEKIWKDIEHSVKAIPRASRAIGFDSGELFNRIGNWLQVKDLWIERNPEKNWKSKEAIEDISYEATRLSGAFNRAGLLPYQEGMLSIIFQFAAINHKMLLNLLQDNATTLSGTQRAKLAAARSVLYGGKYGIPGGAVAYYLINKSDEPEIKENAELIKRGFIDYAANGLMASLVEPDEATDLAVSKMMSPYSEGFLPYFQVGWELQKFLSGETNAPRYPSLGMISALGQAGEDMHGWWITREVNETNYKQMFMEAAEVASAFNHYTQGLMMLGMKDKVSKMGQKYGMDFTASEAYAKMFTGATSWKEEDLFKLVFFEKDIKKQKKEMANVIVRQLSNQRIKGNETEYETRVRKLNSFFNVLDSDHFSPADKLEVLEMVEEIDKRNYTTLKQSILVDHFNYRLEERTVERQQMDDIISNSRDRELKKYWQAIKEGKM